MNGLRWSPERAWAWHAQAPWLLGFNYVPSTACNTTEMWQRQTFDPAAIDRELGWASAIGFNSARIFVQYLVWKNDPDGLIDRIGQVLRIATRHRISVVPVLFDDCAFGESPRFDPYLGPQPDPTPGMILPSWTPSPGRALGMDPAEEPSLKRYLTDVIAALKSDPGIVFWDLFNEPGNVAKVGTAPFLERLFDWARESAPPQPLTVGSFTDNESLNKIIYRMSDVLSFHAYTDAAGLARQIEVLRIEGYPILCTEWMARGLGSRYDTDLALFKQEGIGCYQWGLVNGRTQCQYPWSNKRGDPIPETGWFHDLLHPDGTPYHPAEVETISRISAGQ